MALHLLLFVEYARCEIGRDLRDFRKVAVVIGERERIERGGKQFESGRPRTAGICLGEAVEHGVRSVEYDIVFRAREDIPEVVDRRQLEDESGRRRGIGCAAKVMGHENVLRGEDGGLKGVHRAACGTGGGDDGLLVAVGRIEQKKEVRERKKRQGRYAYDDDGLDEGNPALHGSPPFCATSVVSDTDRVTDPAPCHDTLTSTCFVSASKSATATEAELPASEGKSVCVKGPFVGSAS